MIYAYAAVAEVAGPLPARGLAGERVRLLEVGRLQLAVGVVGERPSLGERSLRAHDRVVRRLAAAAAAVLPMRFGTVFADEVDLRRALRGRVGPLRRALRQVRGAEQMTVRVAAAGTPPRAASARTSGARYLRERAERWRLAALDPLREALGPLLRAERVEAAPGGSGLLASVYHLVPRGSARRYRAIVLRSAPGLKSVRLRVSGPWPCYAFSEAQP